MGLSHAAVRQREGLAIDQVCGFGAAIALGLLLTLCTLMTVSEQHPQVPTGLASRINPNTAGVASLARLPGIGLTRASAIVAYRTRIHAETGQENAFACPADLERVKGIGSHTSGQMAPWLVFDPSDDDPPARDISAD